MGEDGDYGLDLGGVRVHERPWVWVLCGVIVGAIGASRWGTVEGWALTVFGGVVAAAGTIALGIVLGMRYLNSVDR